MFLNVCRQTFHISHVHISRKVKHVLMWNFQHIFMWKRKYWQIFTAALYTYFYNISLSVLRPTFFNICNLPFWHSPNIGKIRVKVGPKNSYFTNRIEFFSKFFSLICSQPREKQNHVCDFLLFRYFLNNVLLTVFMQNTSNSCNKKWMTLY